MNDKHLKINFLLILKREKKYFTIKKLCYIHFLLPMGNIWAHMARVNCPNKYFSMKAAYSFFCKIHVVCQNQKKISFQIFVIHLNRQTLKSFFLQIIVAKTIFFNGIELYTFFLLYMWAKYEPIWTYFTSQTVILCANWLVRAKGYLKALFFFSKRYLIFEYG